MRLKPWNKLEIKTDKNETQVKNDKMMKWQSDMKWDSKLEINPKLIALLQIEVFVRFLEKE